MKKILYISLLLFLLSACSKHKHIVFVVDTSGSMLGKNLMQDVKNSIKEILLDYGSGDKVSIITFDTEPNTIYDKEIRSNTDLKEIFGIVDNFSAKGTWTCLVKAMDYSLKTVSELVKTDPRANVKIVLYTDGKDDPPPEQGKSSLNFGQLIKSYYRNYVTNKAWYIYYVELDEPDPNLEKFLSDTDSGEIVKKEEFRSELNVTKDYFIMNLCIATGTGILMLAVFLFLFRNRFTNTSLVPLDKKTEIPERLQAIELKKGFFNSLIKIEDAVIKADMRGHYYIEPASTGSAIYVEGTEVKGKTRITTGQKIQIGKVKFLFEKKK
jgi:hypothetical protein